MGCHMCIRGLAGSVGTQGPSGYRWYNGHWRLLRSVRAIGGQNRVSGV